MLRTAFVSSMLLVVMCWACGALAQSEFKPTGHPTSTPVASESGTGGRGRVSMHVVVGEQAPDFELAKIDGTPLKLSALRGEWVMIWFAESRDSLVSVEPVAASLQKQGVRTLAVCYEKTQTLAHRLKGHDLSYIPLADPTGEIIALYGLLDSQREAVQPGFVLVNPHGDVRMALLGHQLPTVDALRLVQLSVEGE